MVLAEELKELGCDFIDVSSGGLDPRQKIPPGCGLPVPFAEKIRKEADIPTMAVGLIAGAQQAEDIVASGQADFVVMARGAMCGPALCLARGGGTARRRAAAAQLRPRAHPRELAAGRFRDKKAAGSQPPALALSEARAFAALRMTRRKGWEALFPDPSSLRGGRGGREHAQHFAPRARRSPVLRKPAARCAASGWPSISA